MLVLLSALSARGGIWVKAVHCYPAAVQRHCPGLRKGIAAAADIGWPGRYCHDISPDYRGDSGIGFFVYFDNSADRTCFSARFAQFDGCCRIHVEPDFGAELDI